MPVSTAAEALPVAMVTSVASSAAVVDDEAEAVRAACDLLEKMGGLDEEKKADIETRMAAGERVLTAQEPPKWESRCEACGAGLVSEKTTETCLACGGSGERVFFGKF